MNNKSRLAWRCRRGMREMDILFERFIAKDYDKLSLEQKQHFEDFLNEADVDIYAWITGNSSPDINEYRIFVSQLQQNQG